jgi:hypothetical protein
MFAYLPTECGDILETAFQLDERKFKFNNGITRASGRDSRRTSIDRKSLFQKQMWLGGRDSSPLANAQRASRRA